jgi:hypothetical protein
VRRRFSALPLPTDRIPTKDALVAQVEIISEQEVPGAWRFAVQILDDRGSLRKHTISMSWADYNLWSPDGTDEPGKVLEAAVLFLVSRTPAHDLADKFDASIARRRFADADEVIPRMVRR